MILPPQMTTAFAVFDRGVGTPSSAIAEWGDKKQAQSIYESIARKQFHEGRGGRLDKIFVQTMEDALEAEYVPFYFHDLRTNEIISFHAFLEDVKDSYSVNYADTGGYGRIDKVKVYQDTERSINVTFWIAATSKEDFDSMWWSINKLITLLYPQWSMGTQVESGNLNFVQPFSQIPTASPMIRLRVGDIIKSNYSRFNVARLFGLAEAKSVPGADPYGDLKGLDDWNEIPMVEPVDDPEKPIFNISKDAIDKKQAAADVQRINAQKERHSNSIAEKGGFEVGERVRFPQDLEMMEAYYAVVLEDTDDVALGIKIPYKITCRGIPGKVKKRRPGSNKKDKAGPLADLASGNDIYLVEPDETFLSLNPDLKNMFEHDFGKQGGLKKIRYWVRAFDLEYEESQNGAYPGWKTELDKFPYADKNLGQMEEVQKFFSPEENPIIRSFESSMGRGLAGFITSFDMDWAEQLWETEGIGNRAPKALKISISFAPVHDIAPGIDNNGFTRAVNYPVGNIASTFGQDQHDTGYAGKTAAGSEMDPSFNAKWFYTQAAAAKNPKPAPPKIKDGKKG